MCVYVYLSGYFYFYNFYTCTNCSSSVAYEIFKSALECVYMSIWLFFTLAWHMQMTGHWIAVIYQSIMRFIWLTGKSTAGLRQTTECWERRSKILMHYWCFHRACCGEDFSVFGSDNGLVLTCGSGASGCLGHGDWSTSLKPRLIEALLRLGKTHIASYLSICLSIPASVCLSIQLRLCVSCGDYENVV